MKILIIEDTHIGREVLKKCVEESGHEIVGTAIDGADGILQYDHLKPDLVLLDISMPNIDGIGCLKEIKKRNKDAKVIICSAVEQKSTIALALKMGAMDYFVKPFNTNDVIQKIKDIGEVM